MLLNSPALLVFVLLYCLVCAAQPDSFVGPDATGNLVVNATAGRAILVNGLNVVEQLATLSSMQSSLISSISSMRAEVSTLALPKRYIYIVGGAGATGIITDSVMRFDGSVWTDMPSLTFPRFRHGVAVFNNALYAIGGSNADGSMNSTERFDGTSWSAAPAMPTARNRLGAVVFNGFLYAIGGSSSAYLNVVEKFNGVEWSSAPNMGVSRSSPGVAVFGGFIYVIGGLPSLASVERYDGATVWTSMPPMTSGRSTFPCVVFNNLLHAIGGQSGTSTLQTVVTLADGAATWANAPGVNAARHGLGAVVYNGVIYAMGGAAKLDFNTTATVETYDGVAWTSNTVQLPSPRALFGVAVM